jgi:hypothetical protein
VISARDWRAHRAAEKWLEGGGDARGVPLDELAKACAAAAANLGRDLTPGEIDGTSAVVARVVQAREVRAKNDEDRARYLAARAQDYRRTEGR